MNTRLIPICVFALLSSAANAVPITWTLQNVVFEDGGTASGSFVYDAVTGIASAANIQTSSETIFGSAYTFIIDTNPTKLAVTTAMGFNAFKNEFILDLFFVNALTDAGGCVAGR